MEKEKSERAIAKMIIECCHGDNTHGYNFCAYELLAWYVDDESKLFDFYTKHHKDGQELQEMYFFNNMFDETWTAITNDFISTFVKIFTQYESYNLMIELEVQKRKVLIDRNLHNG